MARTTRNREAERAIRTVAERVLSLVINEPQLVEMITEREIARRIAAGRLIRAEDMIRGTWEMNPAGRLQGMKDAVDTALQALDSGDTEAAMTALEATILPEETIDFDPVEVLSGMGEDPETEAGDEEPEPEPDAGEAAGDEPRVRRAHVTDDEEETEDEEDPSRPLDMPHLDRKYDCAGCERPIDGNQAQLSFISCREKLCRDCVPLWDRKAKRIRKPAAEQPEPVAAS